MRAKSSGRSLSSPPTVCNRTETTNAVIIADTSLQALIRHQYQRNSSTAPVPAPVMINSFQAPPIDSMRKATAAERRRQVVDHHADVPRLRILESGKQDQRGQRYEDPGPGPHGVMRDVEPQRREQR